MSIDIKKQNKIVEQINAYLNSGNIAEVKLEYNGKTKQKEITVVEIRRKLGCSEPIADK